MDVLHVIHQFAPETRGGSESYLLDVAKAQQARGLDVRVLTGSLQWTEMVRLEQLEVEGLQVHRLHRNDLYFDHHAKGWHPGVEALLSDWLRRLRPRLLHVHHWVRLTNNLVEIAAELGIPSVVTLHDYSTSCPRAFRRRADDDACQRVLSAANCAGCVPRFGHESALEMETGIELYAQQVRAELGMARAVLVATGATADLLATMTDVPRATYRVLPFGYRPRFAGLPRLDAPAAGEPFRFAFWGGVGPHKGVAVLVEAFLRLCAAGGAKSELHVLGGFDTPEFERQLRTAAASLPVTFHGAFGPEQLRAVRPHCGVFPSTCMETWGIVLDECFELGLPCVVSDLGALAERAGAAGLSVRAGDAAALAAAMQRVRDEPGTWQQMAAAAATRVPKALSAHVDEMLAIYEQVWRTKPTGPAVEPVSQLQRSLFLMLQRESALGRACPPGGPR